MKKITRNKPLLFGLLLAGLIVIVGLALWRPWEDKKSATPDPSASVQNTGSSSNPQDENKNTGSESVKQPDTVTNPDSLQAPFGTFVSNHSPVLDPSSSRNAENSSCQTTAGASCTIQFTKDGVTKSLSAQTTDSNGVTTWNWTPQDVGLSAGTWEIKAIATLGSVTKSTTDTIPLQVQP